MKKYKKLIIAATVAAVVVAALFTAIVLTAGGNADVLAAYSEKSFAKVYETCENEGYIEGNSQNFTLQIEDGAQFYKEDGAVGMRIDLQPFIEAGLDVSALPQDYGVSDGVLNISAEYSRSILGYHTAMGHFNFTFKEGSFEWAADMSDNDKDIVFALKPQAFIDAGVDPDGVRGWSYSKVEMHMDGKTVEELLFLKPYNVVA